MGDDCNEKRLSVIMAVVLVCGAVLVMQVLAVSSVVQCSGCGNVDVDFIRGYVRFDVRDNSFCSVDYHSMCSWSCSNCGSRGTADHYVDGTRHIYVHNNNSNNPKYVCQLCGYEIDA